MINKLRDLRDGITDKARANPEIVDLGDTITREEFCSLCNEVGLTEVFYNWFDYMRFNTTKNFLIFFDSDLEQITVFERSSLGNGLPISISWYKVDHLGRCLCLTGIKDKTMLKDILNILKTDIEGEN